MNNIAEKLKEYKEKTGLSYREIGDLIGVSESIARKIASGDTKANEERLAKIANLLGVPYEEKKPTKLESRRATEYDADKITLIDYGKKRTTVGVDSAAMKKVEDVARRGRMAFKEAASMLINIGYSQIEWVPAGDADAE